MFMPRSGVEDTTRWVMVAYLGWHLLTEVVLMSLNMSRSKSGGHSFFGK